MAAWLAGRGWRPALILCSAAVRTQQTLARAREILGPARIQIERSLYLASAQTLRRSIAGIDDAVARAMIIGHNPGLEDLARGLDHGTGEASLRLQLKFPTAAMAWFRTDADRWRDGLDTAELVEFMTPGDIAGDDQD